MVGDIDGEVGLVNHEDDWSIGFFRDGDGEVGLSVGVVVETTEEDVLPFAVDSNVFVNEHGEAVVFHVVTDDAAADGGVVISEDSESLGTGELTEDLGAATGGFVGHFERQGAAADEVSGDEEEIGLHGVDPGDDLLNEVLLGVLLEVDVGELDDAEAVKCGREVADVEGGVGDLEIVAGDLVGVEGESRGGGCGSGDEGATGEQGGLSR